MTYLFELGFDKCIFKSALRYDIPMRLCCGSKSRNRFYQALRGVNINERQ